MEKKNKPQIKKSDTVYDKIEKDDAEAQRFNFFLKRTCHRNLGQYWNASFRSFLKKNVKGFELKNVVNKKEMDQYIQRYAQE